jgi:deferrochelatase/peroxidase EfeB
MTSKDRSRRSDSLPVLGTRPKDEPSYGPHRVRRLTIYPATLIALVETVPIRLPGVPPDVVEKRSIMRAGIPFGPEVTPQEAHDNKTHKDHNGQIPRGLAFVCYQSILANGFEFLQEGMSVL